MAFNFECRHVSTDLIWMYVSKRTDVLTQKTVLTSVPFLKG